MNTNRYTESKEQEMKVEDLEDECAEKMRGLQRVRNKRDGDYERGEDCSD